MLWSELKRLIFNRRFAAVIFTLVTILLFVSWRSNGNVAIDLMLRRQVYDQVTASLQKLPAADRVTFLTKEIELRKPKMATTFSSTQQNLVHRKVLEEIRISEMHVENYAKMRAEAISSAEALDQFTSLISDSSGTRAIVIKRIAADFKRNQSIQVISGNNLALEAMLKQPFIVAWVLVAMLFLLLQLQKWHDEPIGALIASTFRGRGKLRLVQSGVLLFASLLAVAVIKGAYFAFNLICFGGGDQLWRPIQSIPEFFAYPWAISILTWLVLRLLFDAFVVWVISLIVWCVFKLTPNIIVAVPVVMVVLGGCYSIYAMFQAGDHYYILRLLSLWGWFDSSNGTALGNYLVWFGRPVYKIFIILASALSCGVIALTIILSSRFSRRKMQVRRVDFSSLKGRFSRAFCGSPFSATVYRILIPNCGLLILAAFGLLTLVFNQEPAHYYSEQEMRMSAVYQKIEGTFDARTYAFLDQYEMKLAQQASDQSRPDYELKWFRDQITATKQVRRNLENWQQMYPTEKKIISDPQKVLDIWGEQAGSRQATWLLQTYLSVVLLVSFLYRHEQNKPLRSVIQSTSHGRGRFIWQRRGTMFFIVTVVWLLGEVGQYIALVRAGYNLPPLAGQIHSVPQFLSLPLVNNFGQLAVAASALRWLGLICMGLFIQSLAELRKVSHLIVLAIGLAIVVFAYIGTQALEGTIMGKFWLLLPFGQTARLLQGRLTWYHLTGAIQVIITLGLATISQYAWHKPRRNLFSRKRKSTNV